MSQKNRFLLIQIREHPKVRREELYSFAKFSKLSVDQIDVLNMFDTPHFSPEMISQYQGVFIGGSSNASVLEPKNYPFLSSLYDGIRYMAEKEIPVFASCFGFQAAVLAFGGNIIKDQKDFEMGTLPIELTEDAKKDPLFMDTPSPFLAVSVHQERAITLPENCQLLAKTSNCCHAFKLKGKPFWAFQFHPEVDKDILVERLLIYREKYTQDFDHYQRVIDQAQETPESNLLVQKFMKRVIDQV